jgi:hypothetical protein
MQSQPKTASINIKQISIGLIVLLIGTVFYFIDRPPGDVYFVKLLGTHLSRFDKWPAIFGRFGANLPSFVHAFSFSLISASILSCRIRGAIIVCLSWVLINILFELGQKYHTAVNRFVPEWFDEVLFFENTRSFFRRGNYDHNDVIATCLGGLAALLIIVITMDKNVEELGNDN